MAPISAVSSASNKSYSSSSSTMCNCQCGHEPGSRFSFDLPISRRGLFFQDSFFDNSYDSLDTTIRRIMERWGATDLLADRTNDTKLRLSNNLSRYRQMRTHNLREEDQAVTVASDTTSHKIVMDVSDFVKGELKVKVMGERELVVEGLTETNRDFTMSSNSFRRRFILPQDTNISAITSVMSSDGVLTITAPRMVQEVTTGCTNIPIQVEGSDSNRSKADSATQSSNSTVTNASTCHCQSECQQAKVQNTSSSVTSKPRNIPINMGSFLPITRRGHFFEDSYFEGIRQDFQKAVNDVLTRWGEGSVLTHGWDNTNNRLADNLTRYRQIRARDLKVDNQAVNITSDEKSHKLVVDVHEFNEGEVKVRVVGEREVVVEGRKETRDGDFSVFSNTFRRRFCLPQDSNMEAITSVMSSDGVLTVTVPRTVKPIKSEETVIPIKVEGNQPTEVANNVNNITTEAPLKTETENFYKKKQETETTFLKGSRDSSKMATSESFDSQQNISQVSSCTSTQTDGRVSGPVGVECSAEAMKSSECKLSVDNQSICTQSQPQSQTPRPTTLPVTTRGLFFADSFFKDSWQDFQEAVRDVVARWGDLTSTTDHLTHYRSLRARDMNDETQAVKSSEDETNYKIVLDVKDFTECGTINVRSVNEREVVVEGQVDREEGGVKLRKQFHRRFVLPQDIYLESVTSVMSSDGVLTITAPKKPVVAKIREMIIPVSIEEGIHKSESLKKVSEENTMKKIDVGRTMQSSDTVMRQEDLGRSVSSVCCSSTKSTTSHHDQAAHDTQLTQHKAESRGEHIIPVRLEEQEQNTESQQENVHTTCKASQSTMNEAKKVTQENVKILNLNQSPVSNTNSAMSDVCESHSNTSESEVKKSNVGWPVNQVKSNFNKVDNVSVSQAQEENINSQQKENVHTFCNASQSTATESKTVTQNEATRKHLSQSSASNTKSVEANVCETHSSNAAESDTRKSNVGWSINQVKSNFNKVDTESVSQGKSVSGVCEHKNIQGSSRLTQGKCVPIISKGAFFTDSFFENTRNNFTNAVQEVLKKTEQKSGHSSELTSYRSLLRRNPNWENQAVHKHEDEHSVKFLLDVSDFVGGDVKVAVVEGKEIVVEGEAARQEGSSASSLSFRRVFTLPRVADVDSITSAMSSDGVLIITTPKRQELGHQDNPTNKVVTESQARVHTQAPGSRGWTEKSERKESKDSEGCSSHSYTSSYASQQQQYSSNNTF